MHFGLHHRRNQMRLWSILENWQQICAKWQDNLLSVSQPVQPVCACHVMSRLHGAMKVEQTGFQLPANWSTYGARGL